MTACPETPGMASLAAMFAESTATLLVSNGGEHWYAGRGVSNLLRLVHEEPQVLQGAKVVDKVVGKAAAALMVIGGVDEVYAFMASRLAVELLQSHGVKVETGLTVGHIENRSRTGWCPLETACRDLDTPQQMLEAITETLRQMKLKQKQ